MSQSLASTPSQTPGPEDQMLIPMQASMAFDLEQAVTPTPTQTLTKTQAPTQEPTVTNKTLGDFGGSFSPRHMALSSNRSVSLPPNQTASLPPDRMASLLPDRTTSPPPDRTTSLAPDRTVSTPPSRTGSRCSSPVTSPSPLPTPSPPSWTLGPQHRSYVHSAAPYLIEVPGGPEWDKLLAGYIVFESLSSVRSVSFRLSAVL